MENPTTDLSGFTKSGNELPSRNVGAFKVREIGKTGSKLHLVSWLENEGQEKFVIVRNSNLPKSSSAIWEFLDTYASQIFPHEIREVLFGQYGKPQIAPILKRKNEKNRAFYSGKTASAFSPVAGIDTEVLLRNLNLEGLNSYFYTNSSGPMPEGRWLDCVSYHLVIDLIRDNNNLDSNNALISLINKYWKEFERLNRDKIEYQDLLVTKELRREDMDDDSKYLSSLKLVTIGHQIVGELIRIYRNADPSAEWKGMPIKNVLLFLIHLYQTSVQQSILWWLGISHGHLHMYNTVSQVVDNNEGTPVNTTIIDFDNSKTSFTKLAENDELLKYVDGNAVSNLVKDTKLNPNIRIQLAFYLPLELWDNEIAEFVRSSNSQEKSTLLRLIVWRACKGNLPDDKFTWFAEFVYKMEKDNLVDGIPQFRLTHIMLSQNSHQINESRKSLFCIASYYKTREVPAADTLDKDQKILLMWAIYYCKAGNHSITEWTPLSDKELNFIVGQLDSAPEIQSCAVRVLKLVFIKESDTDVCSIKLDADNPILQRILQFFLSQPDSDIPFYLLSKLAKAKKIDVAINALDFEKVGKDQAILVYKKMRGLLLTLSSLEKDSPYRQSLLQLLDKRAKKAAVISIVTIITQRFGQLLNRSNYT